MSEGQLRDRAAAPERRLAELAAYHVGLFSGAASKLDKDSLAIANALTVLIMEAGRLRKMWLVAADG